MKKIIWLILVCLIVVNCNDDDDSPRGIPSNEKFVKYVYDNENEPILELSYYPDKKILSYNLGNYFFLQFTYENDRINELILAPENTYEFHYDNAGNITSFSYENEVIPVEYNPAEKKYYVEYPDSNELTLYLNEAGDIKKLIFYDAIEDETNTINIAFDGGKKGGLANTNMINVHMVLVTGIPIIAIYSTFMTNVPVSTLTMTETLIVYENEYDSDGFLTQSNVIINGQPPLELSYEYSQL